MIHSFRERKEGKMKQLSGPEIRAIYRWLREEDRKIYVYERMIEDQGAHRPVRGLRKLPGAAG